MNETQTAQTDSIIALIRLGREQRAIAHAAEESRLKLEASQRNQQHQAILDALRSAVTFRLPQTLHPYVDWDALVLDDWHNEYILDIDVPECAGITVTLARGIDTWEWNGRYTVHVPDHVEFDYENGYNIHYTPQIETELTLALAAAADAYPRLQQLQAECKALDAGRLDRVHDDEMRLESETADEDNQSAALLCILKADPVLRAFFHAVIAYQNSRVSWDAQLAGQYEAMNALERRYEEGLNRVRRDAYSANEELQASRARATELEDQVIRLQANRSEG